MDSTELTPRIFPIATFISDLPTNHIFNPDLQPDGYSQRSGRLIIIGDVHGMRKSLEALLDEVCFDKRRDHLILVGDLVNKGPDSAGVIDIATELGASAVRGNHDNAVLNAAEDIKANIKALLEFEWPGEKKEKVEKLLPEADKPPKLDYAHFLCQRLGTDVTHSASTHTTAEQLSDHHLEWLAGLPLILRISLPENLESPFNGTLTVVHAGLVPDIPLEEQDPHTIMHMRSLIHRPYHNPRFAPGEDDGDESWIEEWDEWQDQLSSKTTVVFGHDAKRRVQLGKYAIGLDSGCLYGNQLSALVIWTTGKELDYDIVQVECADTPVASKR